jgi:SAM-dependent methyltransferase
MKRPADWQLPAGVGPGLWEYLSNAELAAGYDAVIAESGLTRLDRAFVGAHLAPKGVLLDLGCGTGRFLELVAGPGLLAIGIDLSDPMLAIAAQKTLARHLPVHFMKANIVELDCITADSADWCLCMFGTLGLVVGQTERQAVLQHAARVLRPGGKLILHVHNRWQTLWTPGQRLWLLRDLWRRLTNSPDAGDVVMPFHQGVANLRMHLFMLSEVKRMLRRVGLMPESIAYVGHEVDGSLRKSNWMGWLRAQGFLLAARKVR